MILWFGWLNCVVSVCFVIVSLMVFVKFCLSGLVVVLMFGV